MNSCQNFKKCVDENKSRIYKQSSDDGSLYDNHIYDNHTINQRCYRKNDPSIVEGFCGFKHKRCMVNVIKVLLLVGVLFFVVYYLYKQSGGQDKLENIIPDLNLDSISMDSFLPTADQLMAQKLGSSL